MPDVLLALAPRLARAYLWLVALTSRYRISGHEEVERARERGGAVLWAIWHNRLLGPLLIHRRRKIGVVISRSRDGELISRVVAGFGYVPLRGSSSRAGASALIAVLRHLRRGFDVAFTPDGPKGPRYTVQPGLTYAARRADVPVIPVGVGMSRKLVFSSWDRFQVPLPFGTIQLVYGAPLAFGRADEAADAETVRSAILEVTDRADRLLDARSP
ncbi:MAG: lysophospholipid acyltransferase family protein [Deltaproteobacteria bacterium]|nr:lysophospholipid acyltransferase family protein [Deltaproteobacteria bacterium]